MNRRALYGLAGVGVGVGVLLLGAGCTAAADTKPLENRIAAVEQTVASAQTKLAAVESKAGRIAAPAGTVNFVVTGVELKGSTSTKDLAAPPADPKTLSDGYRYKKPGDADKADATKWEVSTYVWSPGAMTVLQGDKVRLKVFIVNGDKHTSWIEGPDGKEAVKEQVQNRGREYVMEFTASQVGNYNLHCNEHHPTMHSVITVLPRT